MLRTVVLVLGALLAGAAIWVSARPNATEAVLPEILPEVSPRLLPDDSIQTTPVAAPEAAVRASTLRGQVTFERGAPMDTKVEVAARDAPRGSAGSSEAFTPISVDRGGAFAIPPAVGADPMVRVSWSGGNALFGPLDPDSLGRRPADVQDFALGESHLEGLVLDSSGRPVVGAIVQDIARMPDRPAASAERQARTDARGHWAIRFVPAGDHLLRLTVARQPGHGGWMCSECLSLARGERREVGLGWEPGHVTWSGQLTLGKGVSPGPGFCIRMYERGSSRSLTSCCDDLGRFRAPVRVGTYEVLVWSNEDQVLQTVLLPGDPRPTGRRGESNAELRLVADTHMEIALVGGSVSGRVGAIPPQARASTRLRLLGVIPVGPSGELPLRIVRVPVEERNEFRLVCLPSGRYRLRFPADADRPNLLTSEGGPVFIDVVDGGELTGLELKVIGP